MYQNLLQEIEMVDLKLHLGCGRRVIPGFFHMDRQEFPHLNQVGDISCLDFLSDASASLIYCCHAFEYFDREQAAITLTEWFRVLKPGGILRLAVPDFSALTKLYLLTGDIQKVLGPLYGKIQSCSTTLYHKTAYDERSLSQLLASAGFTDISRYDWRNTEHAQIDDFSQAYFPHMEKDSGMLLSLNMEAKKP